MTTLKTNSTFLIDAVDVFVVRNGVPAAGRPQIRTIQIKSNGATGSITVRARRLGSSGADWEAIPYESLHLNGAAGTGGLVSTAITGDSLIRIDDTGLEIALDCTALSAGNFTVETSVGADL